MNPVVRTRSPQARSGGLRVRPTYYQLHSIVFMNLQLLRQQFTTDSTIGSLYIDGEFECFTLEDTVRAPGIKIAGATAIPSGTYEVTIDLSARFGRMMPHVLDVPMFKGIRIHPGNTAKDTEG